MGLSYKVVTLPSTLRHGEFAVINGELYVGDSTNTPEMITVEGALASAEAARDAAQAAKIESEAARDIAQLAKNASESAQDYLEHTLFHYVTDDAQSVKVRIGTQVLVSESVTGYDSVRLAMSTG